MKPNPISIFLKLSRLHFLLIPIGQAFLGTGMARYLGYKINWQVFFFGLGWLISLQLGAQYLIQYFNQTPPRRNNLPKVFSFYQDLLGRGENQLPRRVALGSATGMFTITTIFTLGMLQFDSLNLSLVIVMGLILLLSLSLALPVVNLHESGLGELIFALLIGILLPGLGFLLQAENPHRIVILVTFPLAILLVPVMVSFEFPNYSISSKPENHNLIQQLGWQNAMAIHNSFILLPFIILGLTAIAGMPLRAAFSPFLALPLAFLQIWQMRKIAAGVKPNWLTLTWNAVVIFELVTYLLAISFWLG